MPKPASQDETRLPAQQADAEVEKLYESCCGSCGSPSPTSSGVALEVLTPVPMATDRGNGHSKP